jgi:hypothetical protein
MPRQSVNRLNTGTRKNEGDKTFKIISGTYENTTEVQAVPNNRQFEKIKTGHIHKINRPAFKYKEQKIPNAQVPMYVTKRTGTGNYNIRRPNFKAEPIKPRNLNFEKMELQSLQDAGIPVSIGDETLDKLFAVQIADPSDGEWLIEVQRRKNAGETDTQIAANPPFRREQRTITKNINFATSGLKLEDKIELLKTAVMSNSVETQKELTDVITSITLILREVEQLSNNQTKAMGDIISRLNIPLDPFEAGLTERVYTLKEYQDNVGLINAYIYARARRTGLDVNSPVEGEGGKPIKLSSLASLLSQGKGDVFFDVVDMRLIGRPLAEQYRPNLVNRNPDASLVDDPADPTTPIAVAPRDRPFPERVLDDETGPTTTQFLEDADVL